MRPVLVVAYILQTIYLKVATMFLFFSFMMALWQSYERREQRGAEYMIGWRRQAAAGALTLTSRLSTVDGFISLNKHRLHVHV